MIGNDFKDFVFNAVVVTESKLKSTEVVPATMFM